MDDVETEFAGDERLAELFTVYNPRSTQKVINDAKEKYANQYNMDKDDIKATKFESGWDDYENVKYITVAVEVKKRYD